MRQTLLDLCAEFISPEPNSGCWLWTAGTNSGGYGRITNRGVRWATHRLSYTLSCEEIPEGLHVLHSCDVRVCVNPDHLRLGTNADNIADRVARKRSKLPKLRGEEHALSKLTEAQVLEIRELYEGKPKYNKGTLSLKEVAKRYGVGHDTISLIRRRKLWTHI